MKRVAIFGNAGGGKSTLARELASITGLPLHVIDLMQFPDGVAIEHEGYLAAHGALLAQDEWIIDGFGCPKSVWERLDTADTLIHVDLPLLVHTAWVTKRLIKGIFATPEGWPKGSPLLASSLSSYRVLRPCHRHLTPNYRSYVAAAENRRVVHLKSKRELKHFLETIRREIS